MSVKLYITTILCVLATSSYAQSSRDFAVMGNITWASFECSSLASHMNDRVAQERLFNLGYQSGKKFLEALYENKIEEKDISEEVPIGFMLLIAGPSSDFILGRVFENAQENALKDVLKSGEKLNAVDTQKSIASNKYAMQNCRLLGIEK